MIKCPQCQVENKDQAKTCRKCGMDLQLPPLWQPTWRWHARTLAIIYAVVILLFFIVKAVLKPYIRKLPPEITPWLHPKTSTHETQ
jgi:hypothetical protein